jgi:transcriptional regulator GlxA family with amidase domain
MEGRLIVAMFVPSGAQSLDIGGPRDVFEEAVRHSSGKISYRVQVVTEQAGPVICSAGLRILPDRTIHDPDLPIDTLMVAGPRHPTETSPSPEVIDWIRRQASSCRRYGAMCTGAFLMGPTGLLDGKRVTTHWAYCAEFAERYPSAIVEPDRIFVRDGPLFTCGGITAGIDLALALVEEDHGRELALAVARFTLAPSKRPFELSLSGAKIAAQVTVRSSLGSVLGWMREHLGEDMAISSLAERAGMSERNFSRVFLRDTGTTPGNFVKAMRIETARRLLGETSLPLKLIASVSGFAGADAMRRIFHSRLGVGPRDYRVRLRTSATDPPGTRTADGGNRVPRTLGVPPTRPNLC